MIKRILGTLFLGLVTCSAVAAPGDRLVIEFKPSSAGVLQKIDSDQMLAAKLEKVNQILNAKLSKVRRFHNNSMIVNVPKSESMQALIQRLQSDPSVLSVAVDRRIHTFAQSPIVGLLNGLDPSHQARSWYLQDKGSQPASANVFPLFNNFHGTSPTVVAVLDTGVRFDHPMLMGHLLPGYDFVSDAFTGNDGQSNGTSDRDSDPSDPGDGATATDVATSTSCGSVSNSSWHGTFTAGMIAGNPIASEGIFPTNWNAEVEPIRVLGKCGGYTTDLADAIRWAAGLSVSGVPNNPHPARIINMSLGASGACVSSIEGAAITAARNAGAIVVVAAGNNGSTVDTPANCPGALAVSATDQEGLKASYSNFGSEVALSAPGGDSAYPMWGASNTGVTGPVTNTYTSKVGTSFAAPQVSAALALAASVKPTLTNDQLINQLLATTRPFLNVSGYGSCDASTSASFCNCTTTTCGKGMLDTDAFVRSVSPAPLVNLFSDAGSLIAPGGTGNFSAQGSLTADGQTATGAVFTVSNVQKSDPSAANPTVSSAGLDVTVSAPQGVNAFNLTATLGDGSQATAPILVANAGTTTPTLLQSLISPVTTTDPVGLSGGNGSTPVNGSGTSGGSSASGGGGGGGSTPHWPALLLMGMLLAIYRSRSTFSRPD